MSFAYFLQCLSLGVLLMGALYICFSKDLYRMTVAFFLETCALGLILLSKNYDFLAAFLILGAILGVAIAVSFSKVVNGELRVLAESKSSVYTKVLAFFIGTGLTAVLIRALLLIHEARSLTLQGQPVDPDILKLGHSMVGQHSVVFISFISAILVLSVGLTLLLKGSMPKREINTDG